MTKQSFDDSGDLEPTLEFRMKADWSDVDEEFRQRKTNQGTFASEGPLGGARQAAGGGFGLEDEGRRLVSEARRNLAGALNEEAARTRFGSEQVGGFERSPIQLGGREPFQLPEAFQHGLSGRWEPTPFQTTGQMQMGEGPSQQGSRIAFGERGPWEGHPEYGWYTSKQPFSIDQRYFELKLSKFKQESTIHYGIGEWLTKDQKYPYQPKRFVDDVSSVFPSLQSIIKSDIESNNVPEGGTFENFYLDLPYGKAKSLLPGHEQMFQTGFSDLGYELEDNKYRIGNPGSSSAFISLLYKRLTDDQVKQRAAEAVKSQEQSSSSISKGFADFFNMTRRDVLKRLGAAAVNSMLPKGVIGDIISANSPQTSQVEAFKEPELEGYWKFQNQIVRLIGGYGIGEEFDEGDEHEAVNSPFTKKQQKQLRSMQFLDEKGESTESSFRFDEFLKSAMEMRRSLTKTAFSAIGLSTENKTGQLITYAMLGSLNREEIKEGLKRLLPLPNIIKNRVQPGFGITPYSSSFAGSQAHWQWGEGSPYQGYSGPRQLGYQDPYGPFVGLDAFQGGTYTPSFGQQQISDTEGPSRRDVLKRLGAAAVNSMLPKEIIGDILKASPSLNPFDDVEFAPKDPFYNYIDRLHSLIGNYNYDTRPMAYVPSTNSPFTPEQQSYLFQSQQYDMQGKMVSGRRLFDERVAPEIRNMSYREGSTYMSNLNLGQVRQRISRLLPLSYHGTRSGYEMTEYSSSFAGSQAHWSWGEGSPSQDYEGLRQLPDYSELGPILGRSQYQGNDWNESQSQQNMAEMGFNLGDSLPRERRKRGGARQQTSRSVKPQLPNVNVTPEEVKADPFAALDKLMFGDVPALEGNEQRGYESELGDFGQGMTNAEIDQRIAEARKEKVKAEGLRKGADLEALRAMTKSEEIKMRAAIDAKQEAELSSRRVADNRTRTPAGPFGRARRARSADLEAQADALLTSAGADEFIMDPDSPSLMSPVISGSMATGMISGGISASASISGGSLRMTMAQQEAAANRIALMKERQAAILARLESAGVAIPNTSTEWQWGEGSPSGVNSPVGIAALLRGSSRSSGGQGGPLVISHMTQAQFINEFGGPLTSLGGLYHRDNPEALAADFASAFPTGSRYLGSGGEAFAGRDLMRNVHRITQNVDARAMSEGEEKPFQRFSHPLVVQALHTSIINDPTGWGPGHVHEILPYLDTNLTSSEQLQFMVQAYQANLTYDHASGNVGRNLQTGQMQITDPGGVEHRYGKYGQWHGSMLSMIKYDRAVVPDYQEHVGQLLTAGSVVQVGSGEIGKPSPRIMTGPYRQKFRTGNSRNLPMTVGSGSVIPFEGGMEDTGSPNYAMMMGQSQNEIFEAEDLGPSAYFGMESGEILEGEFTVVPPTSRMLGSQGTGNQRLLGHIPSRGIRIRGTNILTPSGRTLITPSRGSAEIPWIAPAFSGGAGYRAEGGSSGTGLIPHPSLFGRGGSGGGGPLALQTREPEMGIELSPGTEWATPNVSGVGDDYVRNNPAGSGWGAWGTTSDVTGGYGNAFRGRNGPPNNTDFDRDFNERWNSNRGRNAGSTPEQQQMSAFYRRFLVLEGVRAVSNTLYGARQYFIASEMALGDPTAMAQADIGLRHQIADAVPFGVGHLGLWLRDPTGRDELSVTKPLAEAALMNQFSSRMIQDSRTSFSLQQQADIAGLTGTTQQRAISQENYRLSRQQSGERSASRSEEINKIYQMYRGSAEAEVKGTDQGILSEHWKFWTSPFRSTPGEEIYRSANVAKEGLENANLATAKQDQSSAAMQLHNEERVRAQQLANVWSVHHETAAISSLEATGAGQYVISRSQLLANQKAEINQAAIDHPELIPVIRERHIQDRAALESKIGWQENAQKSQQRAIIQSSDYRMQRLDFEARYDEISHGGQARYWEALGAGAPPEQLSRIQEQTEQAITEHQISTFWNVGVKTWQVESQTEIMQRRRSHLPLEAATRAAALPWDTALTNLPQSSIYNPQRNAMVNARNEAVADAKQEYRDFHYLKQEEQKIRQDVTFEQSQAFGPGARLHSIAAQTRGISGSAELRAEEILIRDKTQLKEADAERNIGINQLRTLQAQYIQGLTASEGSLQRTNLGNTSSGNPTDILNKINEGITTLNGKLGTLVATD